MLKPQPLLEITSLGGLGDGIGSLDGKPVFVPKACVGDVLEVRIIRENHDGLQAIINNIVTSGPDRVVPPCPHFTLCGGCKLQQLSAPAYRAFKTRMLHSALSYGGFEMADAEMVFVPAGARRRVEFTANYANGRVALGFNELRSNRPVSITNCMVLEPVLQTLFAPLCDVLSALSFAEDIKTVSLTVADNGVDMVIETKSTLPAWKGEFAGIDRISIRHGDQLKTIHERVPVEMNLGNYAIALPPDSFLQATREGQAKLTEIVLESTKSTTSVVDLFCGIGTYSFGLSRFANTHAVEGDATMVQTMKTSITRHAIKTLTAEQRDLFKKPLTTQELARFDAAVINPPRIGAKAQTQALADSSINKIVMVSCNPATFSRDAKILKQAGFTLTRALGIDQFVYSPYLEIVAIFER